MGCPNVKALDPANPFIVSVGPLTGLPGPFNRAEICGKGPQNYPEELFTYSGFGGKFPSELKYAGYDAIVVVGKAEHPVYISVLDNEVQIKDAQGLWGLDLYEIQIRASWLKNQFVTLTTMTVRSSCWGAAPVKDLTSSMISWSKSPAVAD